MTKHQWYKPVDREREMSQFIHHWGAVAIEVKRDFPKGPPPPSNPLSSRLESLFEPREKAADYSLEGIP